MDSLLRLYLSAALHGGGDVKVGMKEYVLHAKMRRRPPPHETDMFTSASGPVRHSAAQPSRYQVCQSSTSEEHIGTTTRATRQAQRDYADSQLRLYMPQCGTGEGDVKVGLQAGTCCMHENEIA